MKIEIKERFIKAWKKYFPECEFPIACFYSDELKSVEFPNAPKPNSKGFTCIFSQIAPVRKGRARAFNMDNSGCFGSYLPLGFVTEITDDVRNYVCNVERVQKSHDHFNSMYKHRPPRKAEEKYLVFKRWDTLEEQDEPQVVFFFGDQDVISGLHGLANFDAMTPYEVIAPFGTGCDSIVGYPMHELASDNPKAVMGPLDPSVRINFKPDISTFSTPWPKFLAMLENMEDSFLTTDSWSNIKKRFMKTK